jgi:hypothetical protein
MDHGLLGLIAANIQARSAQYGRAREKEIPISDVTA